MSAGGNGINCKSNVVLANRLLQLKGIKPKPIFFCEKYHFIPVNGRLMYCLAQYGHQGCHNLEDLITENPKRKRCIYRKDKKNQIGEKVFELGTEESPKVWMCKICNFYPQDKDLEFCLNKCCKNLVEAKTKHPKPSENTNNDEKTKPKRRRRKRRVRKTTNRNPIRKIRKKITRERHRHRSHHRVRA